MSGGTWIYYQGIPARRCVFVRSRGFQANESFVDIVATQRVGIAPPPIGGIVQSVSPINGSMGPIKTSQPLAVLPSFLSAEGTLDMGQVVRGNLVRLAVSGLFVARIEVSLEDGFGNPAEYRVWLVDERHFWTRGLLRQWTFNRLRADGLFALDSVKDANRTPFTLKEVATSYVVAGLFRAPKLSASPDDWATDVKIPAFEPWQSAVSALNRLVTERGTEDPCFRLDRTVALHNAGDGKVGSTKVDSTGKSDGENVDDFVDSSLLWSDGTGHGTTREPGFPEDFIAIRGGERITSVGVDDWEPCLVVSGKPWALNEENIRTLTRGEFGLDWLRRFVLSPNDYEGTEILEEHVLKLLRDQAYRLYRMPGIVSKEGSGPGPNAHLLPLLPRAELVDGRRKPVTVQSYIFRRLHRPLSDSEASSAHRSVLIALQKIEDLISQRAIAAGVFGGPGLQFKAEIDRATPRPDVLKLNESGSTGELVPTSSNATIITTGMRSTFREAIFLLTTLVSGEGLDIEAGKERQREANKAVSAGIREANERDVDPDELAQARKRAATIEFIKEHVDATLAEEYEKKLKEKLKIEDEANRTTSLLILQLGLDLRALVKNGTRNYENTMILAKNLVLESGKGIRAARRLATLASSAPVKNRARPCFYHLNVDRTQDNHASVYDKDLGIIRLSTLGGHLTNPDVSDPTLGAPLIPCPVRVIFGTVVRPRLDVVQGTPSPSDKTATGVGNTKPERDERARSEAHAEARLMKQPEPPKYVPLGPLEGGLQTLSKPTSPQREVPATAPADADERFPNHPLPCKGGDTVVPAVLTDRETWFFAAYQRTGRGTSSLVTDLSKLPLDQIVPIARPDLVELVSLDGSSNAASLREAAKAIADAQFRRADMLDSTHHEVAGPVAVNTDGLVKEVRIASQEEQGALCGFKTIVTTGSSAYAVSGGQTTRSRRPVNVRGDDAAKREGVK